MTTLNVVSISIKKLNGLVLKVDQRGGFTHPNSNGYIGAFIANLMSLGYVLSQDTYKYLPCLTEAQLISLCDETINTLREMKGADVSYNPMYPNFPQQVMEASHCELFFNALVHYWSYGEWKPNYYKLPREYAIEHVKFKEIKTVSKEEFKNIFVTILSSNDSISEYDKSVVKWFIDSYAMKGEDLTLPNEIPYKENMCLVAGISLEQGNKAFAEKMISTTTDVLRICTYLSGGDISLAENTKFKNLPRPMRRTITQILEKVISAEDVNRHRSKWIKLFHNLHVGEYSKKVYDIASLVRNNKPILTFNGRVEKYINGMMLAEALRELINRPSEFARRLLEIYRKFPAQADYVVEKFSSVIDDVPTRILLQLKGALKNSLQDKSEIMVFPKGNVQRAVVVKGDWPKINSNVISYLYADIDKSLLKRFGELPSLGSVWVDPQLKLCPLPTQQRSASEGLFNVARGTQMAIGDKNTLRFFIYWIGQDIDLSATFHDEEFNMIESVSYRNLKSNSYKAYHSGDIMHAPKGACEFIDIDIESALKYGARYVAMNVLVYSGPTFKEHDKCYAGWMTRDHPNSNEIFDAATVEQKVDLTSESRSCVPVLFDLVAGKAIWVDVATSRYDWNSRMFTMPNNIEARAASIKEVVKAIVHNTSKTDLHYLLSIHASARGIPVNDRTEAYTVFTANPIVGESSILTLPGNKKTIITPYDINIINSEYVI